MPAPAILANPWVKAGLFSVGGKLLSGLFGNRAKKKQAEAQRKATIGAAELKNQMSEDTRTAQQAAGQSIMRQLASKGFTNIDPATAAQLAQRRSYDFSKGVPEAGAGLGSELLSGLFGGIGDVASQYAINRGSGGGIPTQAVPSTPDLRSRVGEFDTGIDYNLYPRG